MVSGAQSGPVSKILSESPSPIFAWSEGLGDVGPQMDVVCSEHLLCALVLGWRGC